MKAIAFAIAMAGLAMAANAAIVPATAAAAPTMQCAAKVAEAAETAAVVAVLPEANVTAKAEPSVGKIDAVGESDAAKANQPVVLTEAETTKQSEPSWIGKIDAVSESDAAKTEPNIGKIDAVGESDTAKVEPSVGKINAVGESDAAKANQPVVLTEAETTKQSEPGWIGEVHEADEGEDCSLVGMYSRCRLLSGPWSVKRRLEAARIRGDTEEEERLTELLEEVVCEALKAEEDD